MSQAWCCNKIKKFIFFLSYSVQSLKSYKAVPRYASLCGNICMYYIWCFLCKNYRFISEDAVAISNAVAEEHKKIDILIAKYAEILKRRGVSIIR